MKLKQKKSSLLVLTFVALMTLIWQIYGLLSSDISTTLDSNASLAAQHIPLKKPSDNQQALGYTLKTAPATEPTANQHPSDKAPQKKAYLSLVNRYKLATMEHKILQEELSIAKVRNEIAKYNQNTHRQFADTTLDHLEFGTKTSAKRMNAIKLVYLDYQNKSWSAILKDENGYTQVSPGTSTADGTQVVSIENTGVILQAGQHRFHLSFTGITPLPTTTHTAPPPSNFTPLHRTLSTENESHPNNLIQLETVAAEQKIIHPKSKAHKQPPRLSLPLIENNPTSLIIAKSEKAINKTEPKAILAHSHKKPILNPKQLPSSIASKHTAQHTLDEIVLLEMPAASYTIRLKKAVDIKELESYAKQNHIENRALCYATPNKKFYILVYGDYLTTRAAKTAMHGLPRNTERYTIEQLGKIQKEIVG